VRKIHKFVYLFDNFVDIVKDILTFCLLNLDFLELFLGHFLHMGLFFIKLVDKYYEGVVYKVQILEFLVNSDGFLLHFLYFGCSRLNFSFKLFDLVIQHKLEKIELLGVLFKAADLLLFLFDFLVLEVGFLLEFLDVLTDFDVLFLEFSKSLLVLNLCVFFVLEFLFTVLDFLFGDLAIRFCSKFFFDVLIDLLGVGTFQLIDFLLGFLLYGLDC